MNTSCPINLDLKLSGIQDIPLLDKAQEALMRINNKSGEGADFLGWLNLPHQEETILNKILQTTNSLKEKCDYIVCIGIGGSYIGAKAVIDAFSNPFENKKQILFAGHNLDPIYHKKLVDFLKNKSFGIIYTSKSGTTLEPAICFRIVKHLLISQIGKEEAKKRIITITDPNSGSLRQITKEEEYTNFSIPRSVGGRFSVLSPVGLVPIALAGINIKELLEGAFAIKETLLSDNYSKNIALQYAALRRYFYSKNKKIEILSSYNSSLKTFSTWWEQLFSESEGKENKGIFVTTALFSTDLHSIGQWIQEGERSIFETILSIKNYTEDITIPFSEKNLDQINFTSHKKLSEINQFSEKGTAFAHNSGDVPIIRIELDNLTPYTIGALFFFFEVAVSISAYMDNINPFDQPGVELYKKNTIQLLQENL